jgi:methylthioribose-1-phosphate isomerase
VYVRVKSVQRIGDKLRLLDQTRLPHELVYNDYDRYPDIIAAIKRLEVRGAPAIGIAAAYALAVGVKQTGKYQSDDIRVVANEIRQARPTAVNLTWAVDRLMARLEATSPENLAATLDVLWAEAEAIHREDRDMCLRIGQYGAALIGDGDTVLTHCNAGALATGGIGTALGVVYTCRDQGKRIRVYADETRPLLQGARLTAWELQQEGIDVTLICDSVAGALMAEDKIGHVIVGADRIAANGDTANKIGTYSLALLAMAHEIPFYVAAPASTFDQAMESGADIPIELRSPDEVTEVFGSRVAPEGIDVYCPAFDITPNELITCFITDTGLRPGGRAAGAVRCNE